MRDGLFHVSERAFDKETLASDLERAGKWDRYAEYAAKEMTMPSISEAWTPTPTVLDHSGKPLIANRQYFTAPPAEIGTVMSAYSALKVGQSPHPIRKRFRIVMGVVLAVMVVAFILAAGSLPKNFAELLSFGALLAVVFAIPTAIVTFLILYLFRRDYRCDYVGTEGVADYDLLDVRRGKPGQILRFQDAADLDITLKPQFVHGIPAATAYRYSWTDAKQKEIFFLSGEYYTEKKMPEDKFHFAAAAEAAWWEYQRVLRLALNSQTAS
jgi:hypothetical protein